MLIETLALPRYGRPGWKFCCVGRRCCRLMPQQPSTTAGLLSKCGWARRRDYDRMIAAHAISSHSIFVTNNLADFNVVPGLSMENWVV